MNIVERLVSLQLQEWGVLPRLLLRIMGVVNPDNANEGCIVEDNAILCAGAKILFKDNETIVIGKGSIVAANAVLMNSTGPNEVWGGIPAKLISVRKS